MSRPMLEMSVPFPWGAMASGRPDFDPLFGSDRVGDDPENVSFRLVA